MDTLAFLGDTAPAFAVRGCQVKVLTEPTEFFDQLCSRAEKSRTRIAMAALYLGTGEKAQILVDSVLKSLKSSPLSPPRTTFLLDYCRGNRIVEGKSSCTLLQPIINDYQDACRVSLYHTPNLRGLWKRMIPDRYNETIGLQHCKLYVFDNSVLVSGANLSTDYFTNRQDRYVIIEDCEPLATFCEELIGKISDFSLQLQSDGGFVVPDACTDAGHPYKGDYDRFVTRAGESISEWFSNYRQAHKVQFNEEKSIFESCHKELQLEEDQERADTWIFPSIQMGPFNVRHDSCLTTRFLQSGAPGAKFKFATGYFNLTNDYQNVILNTSQSHFDILSASPKANGFYGARGPAGGITHAYTLISKQFFDKVQTRGSSERIRLFEYYRDKWTFHSKGLWYYLPGSSYPIATMVGSANFGFRSVEKDLEAQMTIVTRNETLQQALHHEQERLFLSSEAVSRETFDGSSSEDRSRAIPLWVRCVVGLFRKLF